MMLPSPDSTGAQNHDRKPNGIPLDSVRPENALACKNTKLRAFRPVGTLLPKEVLEIGYGLCQSFSKLGFGFPLKDRLRHRDVWLPLSRVIRRQRLKTNLGLCPGHFDDEFGKLPNGELLGIADVDRTGHIRRGLHHPNNRLDEVVNVTKRARLGAIPVNGDLVTPQRLHDKIGDYAPIIGVHPRAVSVKDTHDLDRHIVLSSIVEKQSLRAPFSFVIAGSSADRVDVAPVFFRLRMHRGVAVDLGCRRLKNCRLDPFGEPEHVDGANYTRFRCLYGIELVVYGRGGTG